MDNSSPITQKQIDELTEVANMLFIEYINAIAPHLIAIEKTMEIIVESDEFKIWQATQQQKTPE